MKKLFTLLLKSVVVLLLLAVITLSGLFFALTSSTPLVAVKPGFLFSDLKRAQDLAASYNPAALEPGRRYLITLSARELDMMANTLVSRIDSTGKVNAQLIAGEDSLDFKASYPLSMGELSRFVNVQVSVNVLPGKPPLISGVNISGLQLPDFLTELVDSELTSLVASQDLEVWQTANVKIEAIDQSVLIGFSWSPGAASYIPGTANYADLQVTAAKVQNVLAEVVSRYDNNSKLEVPELLADFFELWLPDPQDIPIVFTCLVQYVSGNSIAELFALDSSDPDYIRVYLQGQQDWARHFLISGMLTAQTSAKVASQLGMLKELSDKDNKETGFSSEDLLANQSGIMFYQRLVERLSDSGKPDIPKLIREGLMPDPELLNNDNDAAALSPTGGLKQMIMKLPFYSNTRDFGRYRS